MSRVKNIKESRSIDMNSDDQKVYGVRIPAMIMERSILFQDSLSAPFTDATAALHAGQQDQPCLFAMSRFYQIR